MASINIRSISVGDVTIQSGNGTPDHIAVKGSIYIDMSTAIEYINKDGIATWAEFLDSTYVFTGGTGSFTGGTVSGATFFSGGLSATTFSATTYLGLPLDIHTTGFTFNPATYDITIKGNDGINYSQNLGILASDMTITGGTYNINTGVVTFTNNTGGTFSVTGFTSGMTDSYTTSANLSGETIQFNNNLQGPNFYNVSLTPLLSDKFNISGGTVSGATKFTNGLTANTFSATTYLGLPTDIFTTGGTYSAGTAIFTNTTGGTFNVTGFSTSNGTTFTGGTVSGATNFTNGLTANTFSIIDPSTTFNIVGNIFGQTSLISPTGAIVLTPGIYGVQVNGAFPDLTVNGTITSGGLSGVGTRMVTASSTGLLSTQDIPNGFTGGTVSGATNFTNGLTANTFSATTYLGLPTDVFVTGGTYTSGNAIFRNNTGGTFSVSGFAIGSGGGQLFYLNLSQPQNGYRLLSTTASTASEQTSGVTINAGLTGTIASFQTQPLNIILLPGGIWSFYLHSYKENNNAAFDIFVEVYKRTSGGTQTLLFATDPVPVTTNSPNASMQLTDGYFSGTSLSVSDSVVAVVRATNTNNQPHIITLVTEGSAHYSYAVSTIPAQQGLTCDTLSGCSIIQTIQTDISNKFDKSGGTVSGPTSFTAGLTANTFSATTYQNLPTDIRVTGGTYSNGTAIFTNNTGGTFNVTGFKTSDVFVTGATYGNNTFTYTNNTGGTFNVLFNTMTGLTTDTISATTYQNLPTSYGPITATTISATTLYSSTLDDYLYDKYMTNQYSYFLPSDASTSYSGHRTNGGTILSTGTVAALTENPMGIQFTTAIAVGSVAGQYGTVMGGSLLGVNFQFETIRKFRITTNNGNQRFFAGISSLYSSTAPTNVDPLTLINSIGVAKLQSGGTLNFVWNDATGTASYLDLGANFLGTATTVTYKLKISKTYGVAAINLELTKIDNSTGAVLVTGTTIASDYNTGVNYYPVIWMGNNTAVSGAVSFKDYGCQMFKRNAIAS